jgi:uncharacterized protein
MIAVDTNILVYAHREDSPWNETVYKVLEELSESGAPWLSLGLVCMNFSR